MAQGRHGSASQYVPAGLQLLEKRELTLTDLRAEIDQGDASPLTEIPDTDVFCANLMARDHA